MAGPRKLNFVSFLMLAAAIAAVYGGIMFGPHYYRNMQAQGIVTDSAHKLLPRRMLQGEAAYRVIDKMRKQAMNEMRAEGIEDPGLKILITMDRKEITVEAMYQVVVRHPLIEKSTTVIFNPKETLRR